MHPKQADFIFMDPVYTEIMLTISTKAILVPSFVFHVQGRHLLWFRITRIILFSYYTMQPIISPNYLALILGIYLRQVSNRYLLKFCNHTKGCGRQIRWLQAGHHTVNVKTCKSHRCCQSKTIFHYCLRLTTLTVNLSRYSVAIIL